MKVASITETKNQLSALIDQVRHGETVLIVDRGQPVARLESVLARQAEDPEGRLRRLERQGAIKRGMNRPPKALLENKPPRPRKGASVLQAVLEERKHGR